ncbi:1-phosphofructokinase [Xanthomonas melonis]|uniref:Phosphofructokinase n=1 Tax=Xanthomonas melonis TaxID=56456 RepID=A0A2S7DED9_9XANT|nr:MULTISPECIES: 1-phosphofructokinase [Xanthomonas]MCC4588451.1 1-phosphofructokinase [Xanthomonas sp. NCPPB 1067]MCC4600372.1 1-phosphofructokinase [Xanthomonas melonis]MCD0247965.1 1-phosphofructokinase [Xanthomonas melonis]MCD0258498.1 1-phosphofructokinase [Xanthomonas melonis]MCD0266822.1 1-phosphofructokinase [Xanthomonas melonis]
MSLQALTITLNPAIDQTIQLETLQPGAVHRASSMRNDAGGKGINVAACLADWGSDVAALGVLGGGNAGVFEALFRERGIVDHCQRVAGDTRTNLKLVDARSNDTTDINLPGLRLGATHLQGVADQLAPLLRAGLPVVLSGSLPAGLPDDSWAQLQARASAAGARVLLDTSGAPLVAALGAAREALPYAVKPNRHELEAWTGRPLTDRAALSAAAHELLARGIQLVVISMGTDGALFVQRDQRLIARPPRLAQGSSVGAGDAMVAGLAAALIDHATTLEQCARLATAFSTCRLESGDARRITPEGVRRAAGEVVIEMLS